MSIATLKRKTMRGGNPRLDPVSGIGAKGFSLNGGYRNIGAVGQFRMVSNVTRTPFRGTQPMGTGGSGGTYYNVPSNSGSCCTNDDAIIKHSSLNTAGMLDEKYKWTKSQYPNYWVKDDDNANRITNTQGQLTQAKTWAAGACNFEKAANDDPDNIWKCNSNSKCVYWIGGKKRFLYYPYAKWLNTTKVQSQGAYITAGGVARLNRLPTPACMQHYPMMLNANGCDSNVVTWQQAQARGFLPSDYMTCNPIDGASCSKVPFTVNTKSYDVTQTTVLGTNFNPAFSQPPIGRGPAIAVLADGTVLLGGGERSGSIFSWNENTQSVNFIGDMISNDERIQGDSRFAISDIAVLSENQNEKTAYLLISFPRVTSLNCIELVVYQVTYNRLANSLEKNELWFKSSPGVPLNSPKPPAPQHASGKMEVINGSSAYLTVGDLGFNDMFDRENRGNLGSVVLISKNDPPIRISQGHRNMLGIALINGDLLVSEHGPTGGDEINLIEYGSDYGWPFVSYGTEYSGNDYAIPAQFGTHAGYKEPLKYWNPSIAPSELVQIPNNTFGKYAGGIVMGTLREKSLVFMRYENKKIIETEIIYVGARIRDLDVLPDKRIIASTDDGRLLIFTSPPTDMQLSMSMPYFFHTE